MSNFTTKPIIVPWDFSEMSQAALTKAIELAESLEQIQVVNVTAYPSVSEPSVVWGEYSESKIQGRLLESFRKYIPENEFPGLTFFSYFGDPGNEVANHAKRQDAGLIVISSHGRSGLSRLLLGSVAERVVRHAPCPVLVLRGSV